MFKAHYLFGPIIHERTGPSWTGGGGGNGDIPAAAEDPTGEPEVLADWKTVVPHG